jgi:hypothetical protein
MGQKKKAHADYDAVNLCARRRGFTVSYGNATLNEDHEHILVIFNWES